MVPLGMGMNIKSKEAHDLARQLAMLTGESMTAVVESSLRERLERERRSKPRDLAERLMEIGRECAPLLRNLPDHGELLYDDMGLPR